MKHGEVFRDNLAYAERMAKQLEVLRDAQFAQIADDALRVWKDPADTDRIAALYLTGSADAADVSLADADLCTPDFARFCRHFTKDVPADGLLFADKNSAAGDYQEEDGETDEPFAADADREEDGSARTAYMQNSYTDRAWRQFAGVVPGMTAEYHSSYPAVCEEVYNGRCRYCILPIYTSNDGQLVSFRKLIDKYDLKICLETEVELADESVMRFALLCRKLRGDTEGLLPGYMDISVVLPENGSAGSLIAACEALGASVTAVYTIPLEYADRIPEFCLELQLPGADLAGLSVFLEASQLRYTIVGMYSII